jgi:tryptophan-rich sensory protein
MTKYKNNIDKWYKNLKKSPLTPPDYVFGIVWPILYFLLLIYFILALQEKNKIPLVYFMIQLILNLFWTTVFFRKKNINLAMYMLIVILFFTILSGMEMYYKNNNILLPLLLVPYIIWLSFAGYLNFYIIFNN